MEEIQSYFPENIAEEEMLSAGDDFGAEDSKDSGAPFKKSPSYLQRFFQRMALSVVIAASGCAFAFREKKPDQYRKIEDTVEPAGIQPRPQVRKVQTNIGGKILAISAYKEQENVHMVTPVKITRTYETHGLNSAWIVVDWLIAGLAIYGGIKASSYAVNRSDEQREIDCQDTNPDPEDENIDESCYAGGFGASLLLGGTTWTISSILSTKEYFSKDKVVDKKITRGDAVEDTVSNMSFPLRNRHVTLSTPKRTIELGRTGIRGRLSVILPGVLLCDDFEDIKPGEQFSLSVEQMERDGEIEPVFLDANALARSVMMDDEGNEYEDMMMALSRGEGQIAPALRFLNRFPHGCMAASVRDFVEKRKKQMFQGVAEVMEDDVLLPEEICSGKARLQRGERVMLNIEGDYWRVVTEDLRCDGTTNQPFSIQFVNYFDPLGTPLREQMCVENFKRAKAQEGIKALKDFLEKHKEQCPDQIIQIPGMICDRTWQAANLKPTFRNLPKIEDLIKNCPDTPEIQKALLEALNDANSFIHNEAIRANTRRNLRRLKILSGRSGELRGRYEELKESLKRRPDKAVWWRSKVMPCYDFIREKIYEMENPWVARERERREREDKMMDECIARHGYFGCALGMGMQAKKMLDDLTGGPSTSTPSKSTRRKIKQKRDDTAERKLRENQKCLHACKINWKDSCGKGLHTVLPGKNFTPSECAERHQECLGKCDR